MPSNSWVNDWTTGDIPTAAEFRKSMGCIFDSTLGAPAATISIATIIGTYAHLEIECVLLSDQAAVQNVKIGFNGDGTAGNYSRAGITTAAASVSGAEANDNNSMLVAHGTTNVAAAPGVLYIPHYAGNQKKAWIALAHYRDSATTTSLQFGGGHWIAAGATAAITTILLTPAAGNFNTGSRVSVYVRGS